MLENADEDALAELRKHFRTVSFTPGTEFINIDLKNEPVPNDIPVDKRVRETVSAQDKFQAKFPHFSITVN